MKRILITRQLQPIAKELLSKYFLVDENGRDEALSSAQLCKAVQEYDGILATLSDRFDKNVLSFATQLKAISNLAIGLDNIAIDYAREKNIAVFNLPDVVTNSTADLTFALLLAFIRKIPQAQEYVLEGRWKGWEPALFLGEELEGKTFGIIGFGNIGKAVARRALGFGLKVIIFNRSKVALDQPWQTEIQQVSWDVILSESDYLSLHVPLTDETMGLINAVAIEKMKKKPVLINMARGGVVDTKALIDALETGNLRGAALDVTNPEPISASHPLCMLENCLIIPHIGSATLECRTLMAQKAAENLINCLGIR